MIPINKELKEIGDMLTKINDELVKINHRENALNPDYTPEEEVELE